MIEFEDFEQLFDSDIDSTFDGSVVEDIRKHRERLGGHLLIEKLLHALGLQNGACLVTHA